MIVNAKVHRVLVDCGTSTNVSPFESLIPWVDEEQAKKVPETLGRLRKRDGYSERKHQAAGDSCRGGKSSHTHGVCDGQLALNLERQP